MGSGKPYALTGNAQSQQAEGSTENPAAAGVAMRTLIELQLIAFLLHNMSTMTEDLGDMRQDIADSIT